MIERQFVPRDEGMSIAVHHLPLWAITARLRSQAETLDDFRLERRMVANCSNPACGRPFHYLHVKTKSSESLRREFPARRPKLSHGVIRRFPGRVALP